MTDVEVRDATPDVDDATSGESLTHMPNEHEDGAACDPTLVDPELAHEHPPTCVECRRLVVAFIKMVGEYVEDGPDGPGYLLPPELFDDEPEP